MKHTGIIYRYTSPVGKHYIGQTVNEEARRNRWNNAKTYTKASSAIDAARSKYGAETFEYAVLERVSADTPEQRDALLNRFESYYIGLFDAYNNGYNRSIGGDGHPSVMRSEAVRKRLKAKKTRSETRKNTKRENMDRAFGLIDVYDLNRNFIATMKLSEVKVLSKSMTKSRIESAIGKGLRVGKYYLQPQGTMLIETHDELYAIPTRRVKVFDSDGNCVGAYGSAAEAAKAHGGTEGSVRYRLAKRSYKLFNGFAYAYEDETPEDKIKVEETKVKGKSITLAKNGVSTTYDSIKEAGRAIGHPKLRDRLREGVKKPYGYIVTY